MSEENQDVILNIDKKMFGKNKSRMPINGSVRSYSQPVDLLSFLGDFDKKKHVVISEFLTEYSKLDKNSLSTFQDFTVHKIGSIIADLLGEVRESYNFIKKDNLDALSRGFAGLSVDKIEEMNKEMSNLIEKQNKPLSDVLSSNIESSFSEGSSRAI